MFSVQIDQAAQLPIVLRSADDYAEAKEGIVHGDVTLKFRKWNEVSWTTDVIDASNWTEVGEGHYAWQASASDLDTRGLFLYTIQVADCVRYEGAVNVGSHVSGGHVEFE